MNENKTSFDRLRNALLVLLPALFLALLSYSALSGRLTKPKPARADTTPPSIMLTRDNRYYVQPGGQYEEEGYAAYDDTDGDLTSQVEISVNGDIVRYRVCDSAGNITVRCRKVPYASQADDADGEAAEKAAETDGQAAAETEESAAETEGTAASETE